VRPSRADIAAPELPGRIHWLNRAEPPRMAELTALGPVLVHFFDFAQLNSVRALPYVLEWHRRYSPLGLTVLGIHSPRFRFSAERETATDGIAGLGIEHPVAIDSDYAIWHDYGCKGWPSLFLWARGGALSWAHFGEGEYQATEEAIQADLRGDDLTLELPPPMEPLRPTDAPAALVAPPSEEVFPGGSPAEGWEPGAEGNRIEVEYAAGGAYVVAERGGALRAGIDGAALEPVCGSGLIALAEHPRHERHRLTIEASPGARVWAISFAPGMPS
jgi:hypothetical protein